MVYRVGDKVVVKNVGEYYSGKVGDIVVIGKMSQYGIYVNGTDDEDDFLYFKDIEPYTEPKQEQNKLNTIIEHYGRDKQILQAVEEMSELQKELIKHVNRRANNRKDVIQEIADVQIMVDQLKEIFECNEEVEEVIEYKIERTLERIKGEGK